MRSLALAAFLMATAGALGPSPALAQSDYYTLTPCRVADSRLPDDQDGVEGTSSNRGVKFRGKCGVPVEAVAVMVNVTVVSPTAAGHVTVSTHSGSPSFPASVINYAPPVDAIANGAKLWLGSPPAPSVWDVFFVSQGGTAELVVDVYGYYM